MVETENDMLRVYSVNSVNSYPRKDGSVPRPLGHPRKRGNTEVVHQNVARFILPIAVYSGVDTYR